MRATRSSPRLCLMSNGSPHRHRPPRSELEAGSAEPPHRPTTRSLPAPDFWVQLVAPPSPHLRQVTLCAYKLSVSSSSECSCTAKLRWQLRLPPKQILQRPAEPPRVNR